MLDFHGAALEKWTKSADFNVDLLKKKKKKKTTFKQTKTDVSF